MVDHATTARTRVSSLDLFTWLGIVVGIVMPVVSALLYPVYMHQMDPPWAEWTRLMELPFIVCELAIIHVAIARGYRDGPIWRQLPTDIRVALGLLIVGLTISSVFVSKNVPASVTLSIAMLIHLRIAAAIFFLASRQKSPVAQLAIQKIGPGLVIGLVILSVMTIHKFHTPPPEWTVLGGRIEWPSALPGFINVRYFGSWTGAIAAGLMLMLLYDRQKRAVIYSLCYLLAAGLTFWSGTRAAVLAMGMVGLIALVTLRRMPDAGALLRVAGLSAIGMLGAIVFAPADATFSLFVKEDLASAEALTSGRLALWQRTINRWLDAPFFGLGSGSTFWEVDVGWWHTQPHNTLLLFLISWGIIGTAGASWLLGRAIFAMHRTSMNDPELLPIAGALYALLCMSLFAGMFHYPRFVMVIMICFGLLFAARDRGNQARQVR